MENQTNFFTSPEDDGSLEFLKLPAATINGKKTFHCDPIRLGELINKEFWILDYEKDVRTVHGNRYLVLIKFNKTDPDNLSRKFFTGSCEIKETLDMINERNAFPRRATLHFSGNRYWLA